MDIAKMLPRIKNILLAPKQEWPIIAAEKSGHVRVLTSWLLPLSLVAAVATLIGHGILRLGVPMHLGIAMAVSQIVGTIGGAYLTAFIVNLLAEKYDSKKDLDQAFALIAYSYTPACLGGLFQIIPPLAAIGSLVGLYGLYLLYVGLPPMMKTPPEKNTGYFVVSLLCVIGVFIVLSVVLTTVLTAVVTAILVAGGR